MVQAVNSTASDAGGGKPTAGLLVVPLHHRHGKERERGVLWDLEHTDTLHTYVAHAPYPAHTFHTHIH